ncbi:OLC1v1002175C1 [Oldenlandia corymbosa var. corymbosa]|uniref:OLC1v1002175C1 n=1 Tax=Oldenlandia corymbosa var. corymbosa TaxID=529605 RepID=A0AAV1D9C9_OLDCO|nr:OLC1v1002175C1 [Oldenlandia corymbosa var. corymbosa]
MLRLILQEHSNKSIFLTDVRLYSLLFLLLFSTQFHHIIATIFIYNGCSQEKYQPNSPYETNLNTLLSSIVNSASQTLYNNFALGNDTSSSSSAQPDGATFCLYQCRGDLKPANCATCVASAVSQINLICAYSYGATLQLEGCLLRYEHFDFLGKQDTSLRFKKCSASVSNDGEFLRRRDDVIADLMTGAVNSAFRVSSSGSVEGYAQCVGDLNQADCSACLANAAAQLKTLCGASAAGDVFLAQCYIRYWAAGYYDSSSPDSYNEDEVGKTVAIIVGSVAGAAVLIVFLSLCRKVFATGK